MKRKKPQNQYEAKIARKNKLEHRLRGEGEYLYRNNTNGTLDLPKTSLDGARRVPVNGEWRGDNYFMLLVKKNEARLVKTISHPERKDNMTDKLIVDQPETVTTQGTVEQVVVDENEKTQKLTEQPVQGGQEEVLLTEDPMDGVEIIID